MKQKKAASAIKDPFTPSATGNAEARKRAKQAKALLRSIKPPGLLAVRNKILKASIKAFENGQWIRGALYSSGSVCSIGAIKRFGRGRGKAAQQAAVYAVADVIPGREVDYPFGFAHDYKLKGADKVVHFNDLSSSPTHRDRVIGAFKRALKTPLRREAKED